MKIYQHLLCQLVTLSYSECLKCLTCESENGLNKDCENGAVSTSKACDYYPFQNNRGCMVSLTRRSGKVELERKCCFIEKCIDMEKNIAEGWIWHKRTCHTDNCNIMDPTHTTSTAPTPTTTSATMPNNIGCNLGIILGLNSLLIMINRKI